jgi:hypothetical protein
MRRAYAIGAVVLAAGALGVLLTPALADPRADKDPDGEYARLLVAAKANPEKADFVQLRLAYAASSHYEPYAIDDKENKAISGALEKGDLAGALREVDQLLDKNYVNIQAHFLAASVCRKMEDLDRLKFHHRFLGGLIGSILKSGTGDSYDSAFRVIDIREEYVVLDVLKLKHGRQSLRSHEGHEFDVFDFERPGQQARTVYFNIDIPRRALRRMLGAP